MPPWECGRGGIPSGRLILGPGLPLRRESSKCKAVLPFRSSRWSSRGWLLPWKRQGGWREPVVASAPRVGARRAAAPVLSPAPGEGREGKTLPLGLAKGQKLDLVPKASIWDQTRGPSDLLLRRIFYSGRSEDASSSWVWNLPCHPWWTSGPLGDSVLFPSAWWLWWVCSARGSAQDAVSVVLAEDTWDRRL